MAAQQTSTTSYKALADHLQQQRRNKRLSIRKISLMTSLPEPTIRALENPTQSDTIPPANQRGLYETYGEALGVTKRRINDLAGEATEPVPSFAIKRLPKLKSLVVFSSITTTVATLVLVVGILVYAAWQGLGLFSSPELVVAFPDRDYMVLDESTVDVHGTAPVEATVLINGEPTTVHAETGEYSQLVYLQEGYNQITVEAVNNFSTKTTRSFVIIYEPQTSLSIFPSLKTY